jgi:ankyrin repeat protein
MSRYSEDKSVSGESVLSPESVALTLEAAGASASASASSDESTIASSRLESAPASGEVSSASESAVLPSSAAAAKSEPDSFELYHLATRKTVLFTVRPGFDFNQRISEETQETILHVALKYGLDKCVETMIRRAFSSYKFCCDQSEEYAILDNRQKTYKNLEQVYKFLLNRGARVDIPDISGKTVLDLAFEEISQINPPYVSLIMHYAESISDVDQILPTGETLLHKTLTTKVISTTSYRLMYYLIKRGASVFIPDRNGKTALDLAFIPGERGWISDMAEALIKRCATREGFDINARIFPGGETLFTKLVTHRTSPELVQYLIDRGGRLDSLNDKGENILDLIFRVDPKDMVTSHRLAIKKYVEFVGDVDRILLSERTPILHEAIKREDTDLIKFLASNGAQFHIPDSEGKTALDLLCEQSRPSLYYEVVDALKIYASREGFDINAAIYPGASTLLHQALKIGDENFVKFLIGKEARIDIRDSDGKTALDLALIPHKNGCLSNGARRFIINYVTTTEGFNINDTIYPGRGTLLHYTLSLDDSGLVKFLMGRGALVNIPDESGRTALDIALTPRADGGVFAGAYFIESYLDRPGNDINGVLNSEGETLLHISLRKNNLFLTGLLMDFNAKVDIPDSSGITALDLAIRIGDDGTISAAGKSIIETYMDRSGFDPDAIIDSRTGETFLNFATRHNLPDLIQKIIIRAEIIAQDEFEEGINYSSWRAARAASASATSDVLVVQTAPDDVSVATEVRLAAAAVDSALTGLSGHHEDHQDFFA